MIRKILGNSNLLVSPYCLGTTTFGETTSEQDATPANIDHCIDSGINFIDTAEMVSHVPY